jgi:Family of unknown function (DUF6879)
MQHQGHRIIRESQKFLAGEPDDLEWSNSWLDLVRTGRAEGRTFCRVRVVSIPLTDYSRFGLWVSQFTMAAGEDIRYIARDEATDSYLGARLRGWWQSPARRCPPRQPRTRMKPSPNQREQGRARTTPSERVAATPDAAPGVEHCLGQP